MARRATIRDVARLAGVSTATVSHVVNGTRCVNGDTRDRVLAAVGALGYSQNTAARQLKTGRKDTIGFVVPDITNLFYASFVQRVSDFCLARGYTLLLVDTLEQLVQEQAHLKALARHVLAGLILASTAERYADIAPLLPEVPTLLFDRQLEGCPLDCVRIDGYRAYHDAAADMARKGHRRIGYLAGLGRLSTSRERLRGFRDGLDAAGFPEEHRHVVPCDSIVDRTIGETLRLVEEGCTAIVASNRSMLVAAICALASRGVRIGEDVQLAGSAENTPLVPFTDRINLISQPVGLVADFLSAAILQKIERPDAPLNIPRFTSVYEPL